MIPRCIQLLCVCAVAVRASAAVSPYASAADYVYQPPALTNLICGKVVGETISNAMGTLRYEDIAYLNEAFFERRVLLGGKLTDLVSFTNHLSNVATNPVLKSALIGQFSFDIPCNFALATNACPITEPRCLRHAQNGLLNTQEWHQVKWVASTNAYSHGTNYIIQVMTNGVADVWTNSWRQSYVSNVLDSVVTTNAYSFYDNFFEPRGLVRMCDDKRLSGDQRHDHKKNLNGPYRLSLLTNLYAVARDMSRSLPMAASYEIYPTNADNAVERNYAWRQPNPPYETTNTVRTIEYRVDASRSASYRDLQQSYGEEWVSRQGYPNWSDNTYRDAIVPSRTRLRLSVNVPDTATVFRASSPRVKTAEAFGLAQYQLYTNFSSSHSEQGDDDVTDVYTNFTIYGECLVPLGTCVRTDPIDGRLTFEVEIQDDTYGNTSSLSGVPFFPDSYAPVLPHVGDMRWNTDEEQGTRYQQTYQYSHSTYSCTFSDFYLILNLTPTTIP